MTKMMLKTLKTHRNKWFKDFEWSKGMWIVRWNYKISITPNHVTWTKRYDLKEKRANFPHSKNIKTLKWPRITWKCTVRRLGVYDRTNCTVKLKKKYIDNTWPERGQKDTIGKKNEQTFHDRKILQHLSDPDSHRNAHFEDLEVYDRTNCTVKLKKKISTTPDPR